MHNKVSTLIKNSRTLESLENNTRKNYELQLKMRSDSDTGTLSSHLFMFPALNPAFSFAKARADIRGEGTMERGG